MVAAMEKQEKEYGRWPSPITAELLTQDVKHYGYLTLDNETLYWTELRPSEGGRVAIVKQTETGNRDVISKDYNARTRVHEYGGRPFAVQDGIIYFVNFSDQRLYKQEKGLSPTPITEKNGPRLADFFSTSKTLYAVAEQHKDNESEAENSIVAIDLENESTHTLISGHDFYASPSVNKEGTKIAWITWNHPNMPWDTTELWLGDLVDGTVQNKKRLSSGDNEAVQFPKWGPDGSLYFISDKSGWWNLYRYHKQEIEAIYPKEAEFGIPLWVLGGSVYTFVGDRILARYKKEGAAHLVLIDPEKKTATTIKTDASAFSELHSNKNTIAMIQASPNKRAEIIIMDHKGENPTVVAKNQDLNIDSAFFSRARHLAFPSAKNRTAYAYYYPPTNKDYKGPEDALPPLLVKTHGGPTSNTSDVFNLGIQYWTSRGFAVLDVDYGGSTGYGRKYRNLLRGNWGIVDREDVEHGAAFLVGKGLVHPKKLAIDGGSAGGYTTLNALAFGDLFTVGASYYGVSSVELLAKQTHKFESRYTDLLIGPYPEFADIYRKRSALPNADRISCPVIFFQGTEDKIVLPNQTEEMYRALKKKGIKTEMVLYDGEQHGFRKAENIQDAIERERAFFLDVFDHPCPGCTER